MYPFIADAASSQGTTYAGPNSSVGMSGPRPWRPGIYPNREVIISARKPAGQFNLNMTKVVFLTDNF